MNNTKAQPLNAILSGVSGEYFVAAELSRKGYIASITLRNTKGVDILCSNSEASKTVGIQVKTNRDSYRSWLLNQKAEDYFSENLFYVFVNLNNNLQSPDFFIVPSKIVAAYCKKSHSHWLKMPGKSGKMHNDSSMRKFEDPQENYKDQWKLLNL